MLPIWRTPHTFGLIPVAGDEPSLPPIDATTPGPLVADLIQLVSPTAETVTRLGRSLGFEWVASLAMIDRPKGLEPPLLATFLQTHYALRPGLAPNPYGLRAGKLVSKRPTPIPTELIECFTAEEAGRLADVGTTINTLARPLLAAATGRTLPADSARERAAKLLNALAPPIKVTRVFDARSARLYVLAPTDLYTRALLELIELLNDRPPVAICARCKRLFVRQRNSDKYCSRYIWPAGGGENIAGCIFNDWPTPTRAQLDSEAHRREYKKLQMRVGRAKSEYGKYHPRTERAQAKFDEWKRDHPIARGRRPTPMPPDLLPDSGRG